MLLVDIGNSRIKWAEFKDGVLTKQVAVDISDLSGERLLAELQKTITVPPRRAMVANVASSEIAELVTTAIQLEWGIVPELVTSTLELAGVRNGYSNPTQLGVDRWLAAVAGYNIEKTAVCIACAGTALTIDAVDRSGHHLGGVIIPGPDLMVDSLLRNTAGIANRMEERDAKADLFATDTKAAVYEGSIHASAGLIQRFLEGVTARIRSTPSLLITGGASGRILPALRVPFSLIPDLVLRGLCLAAGERVAE